MSTVAVIHLDRVADFHAGVAGMLLALVEGRRTHTHSALRTAAAVRYSNTALTSAIIRAITKKQMLVTSALHTF